MKKRKTKKIDTELYSKLLSRNDSQLEDADIEKFSIRSKLIHDTYLVISIDLDIYFFNFSDDRN